MKTIAPVLVACGVLLAFSPLRAQKTSETNDGSPVPPAAQSAPDRARTKAAPAKPGETPPEAAKPKSSPGSETATQTKADAGRVAEKKEEQQPPRKPFLKRIFGKRAEHRHRSDTNDPVGEPEPAPKVGQKTEGPARSEQKESAQKKAPANEPAPARSVNARKAAAPAENPKAVTTAPTAQKVQQPGKKTLKAEPRTAATTEAAPTKKKDAPPVDAKPAVAKSTARKTPSTGKRTASKPKPDEGSPAVSTDPGPSISATAATPDDTSPPSTVEDGQPPVVRESPSASVTPPAPEEASETVTPPPSTTSVDLSAGAEAKEKARYRDVKTKAQAEKDLQALRDKMDAATAEAELRTTSREYYRALFTRMRKLDPTLKTRVDRMEAATLKRLEQD